jgi:hypothetical protein
MPTDPDKALEWALRLNHDEKRRTQVIRAGKRWREKDPEAFSDWLKENDLPEEIRQKILAAPKGGGRMNVKPKPVAAGKP